MVAVIPHDIRSFAAALAQGIQEHTIDGPEEIALALMAEREKVQSMHRRAQKAEGAVEAADYISRAWEKTLAHDQRKIPFWLTIKVLAEIRKALSR